MAISPDDNELEPKSSSYQIQRQLEQFDYRTDEYASSVINLTIQSAVRADASDIHLAQEDRQLSIRFRIAGNLTPAIRVRDGENARVFGRLKALANIVTYRSDIPQEGRLILSGSDRKVEARIGTLPTTKGERAVIRIAKPQSSSWRLTELGLNEECLSALRFALSSPSGVILISGPAGSGKTTTAYACLRELIANNQTAERSIVTLEDPVEQELAKVDQSEVNPNVDYTWSVGLKSLLRQDPEVLMIGEIRDAETAEVVFQASMTGQLVITTMHARSAIDALRRLLDMDVPTHHLRSSLEFLACQRLFPAVCDCHQKPPSVQENCTLCANFGIRGQQLIAEYLPRLEGQLSAELNPEAHTAMLQTAAESAGMQRLRALADQAVTENKILQRDVDRQLRDNS